MNYDIAIIGGGLAGASASIYLAQQGFNVVLFEATDYPRHKVCGEFMSPACHTYFEKMGIADAVSGAGASAIRKTRITTPDDTVWDAELPASAIGISRYVLDEILIEQALAHGVDVRSKTPISDVSGSLDDGFTLTAQQGDTVSARVVIGAYGKRSSLDRSLNREFMRERQPYIGLKQHVANVPIPDTVELHTFEGGYCGMSEIENGLTNVCMLVRQDIFRKHGNGSIPIFIAWMTSQNKWIAERLQHAEYQFDNWMSIAQVPFVNKSLIENDVLMVGDAAGMITPLTGDGMEIALQSGDLAATHIADYLKEQLTAQQLRDSYQQDWIATFRPRIRIGRLSQFFMFRPQLLSLALRTFNIAPPLGDFFIQQTRQAPDLHTTPAYSTSTIQM